MELYKFTGLLGLVLIGFLPVYGYSIAVDLIPVPIYEGKIHTFDNAFVETSSSSQTIPGLAIDYAFDSGVVETSSKTSTIPFQTGSVITSSQTYTVTAFSYLPNLAVDPCHSCFLNTSSNTNPMQLIYGGNELPDLATAISPIDETIETIIPQPSGHSNAHYFDNLNPSGVTVLPNGDIFIGSDDHDVILGGGTKIVNNGMTTVVLNLCENPYNLPLPEMFCMIFYLDISELSREK